MDCVGRGGSTDLGLQRSAISALINLTRRANHRHIFIVAKIKPVPEKSAAGFLSLTICCRARRTWPPRRTELAGSQGSIPPTDGRSAKTMGKPNRLAILQA